MNSYMELLNQDTLLASILMALISVVGLVGNSLMIRALIQYRQLRNDFYTVFGFLSVVDSLFLVISVPTHIMDMFEVESQDAWCKSSNFLMNACGFIAAYLIVVLVVLRAILLTNRNAIRRPQPCHLVIVCAIICVVTSLCSVPVIFMYFTTNMGFCELISLDDMNRNVWLLSSFSEFVPLVLVLVIYITTYLLGKRYFSDSYSAREKEKSRLVSSVIITFAICQTPYRLATICQLYMDIADGELFDTMYKIKNYFMCLLMIDKAIRPILCTKITSDLCDAFDEVINCVSCSKSHTLASKYNRSFAAYATPTNAPSAATTLISNSTTDNRAARTTERSVSSSSSASTTSQTPLTRKYNDADLCIDIIEES